MAQLDSRYIDEQDIHQEGYPIGSVLMYDETDWVNNTTIPGWYVCDGTCGTPNLIDKFVMGTCNSAGCVGVTGGGDLILQSCHLPSHSHTNPDHSHTVNAHLHCMKSHGHSDTACAASMDTACPIVWVRVVWGTGTTLAVSHMTGYSETTVRSYGGQVDSGSNCHYHSVASHYHSVCSEALGDSCASGGSTCVSTSCDTGATGESCGIDSKPEYYSLIFIKKMN